MDFSPCILSGTAEATMLQEPDGEPRIVERDFPVVSFVVPERHSHFVKTNLDPFYSTLFKHLPQRFLAAVTTLLYRI